MGESRIKRFFNTPLHAIETVVAVTSSLSALYFLTPLYAIGKALHRTPLTLVLTHPLAVLLMGVILAAGAILVLIGLYKNTVNIRSIGWNMIFLTRLYQAIAIFLVTGPVPFQWLVPFTLALICILLRESAKRGRSTWLSM